MLNFFARLWAQLQGLVAFFRIVKDPTDQLDSVFELSARLAKPEVLGRIGSHVAGREPYARTAIERQHRIDLKGLMASGEPLPEGSLGREFSEFVKARGIDPADIPSLPVKTREDYVQAHLYETHDLWHVLCGFDTDTSGELGLQAFYLAQMPTPLSLVLIAAGLMNAAFFEIDEKDRRMDEIIRGWRMGREAKILFGVEWSQYWRMPLADVRRQFALAA